MNKCFFIGRTTNDIEIRNVGNDAKTEVGKFSLAVDSGYGENKKTNFFSMTAFGKTAETMVKHVKKGAKIAVECEANHSRFTDRNGNPASIVDFIVRSFEFAESKGAAPTQVEPVADESFIPVDEDDLEDTPF